MALSLNTNVASLNAQRNASASQGTLARALQRLSTGLRINSAADDAAGLAISERMTTQVRGLNQAVRNANDGISLLQTTDAALSTMASSLNRIRELAVQAANSTNSASDKAALQQEIAQLTQEIDRIGRTTTFNGREVFAPTTTSVVGDSNQLAVLDGLKSGWLTVAENLVREHYGIEASGQSIRIELTSFTDGVGNTAARVIASVGGSGTASDIRLQIDMADFVPPNPPNGGSGPFFNDRILAHEMTHAIMNATMNVGSMHASNQQFFLEGTAELIHGADERLISDLERLGNGSATDGIDDVIAKVADWGSAWDGSSEAYSAAYAGMRYLDAELKAAGSSLKQLTTYLAADPSRTLDQALANVSNGRFADVDAFKTDFQTNGAAFIGELLSSGQLTDGDTGAIGGANASGGPAQTAESVVANMASRSGEDQLSGFEEIWEEVAATSVTGPAQSLQIGAEVGQTLAIGSFAMNGVALDIMDADVTVDPNRVIAKMDRALDYVNARRAELGAQLNRIDSSIINLATTAESLTASRSRIQDADYAAETAALTRARILQQAGTAMIAQANVAPQLVLNLLT